MIALLAALAFADPPARPDPPAAPVDDCPGVVGVPPGGHGPVDCRYDAVPTAQLADLLQTEDWAKQLDARYRLDVGAANAERDAARAEAADLRKLPRPGVCRVEGIAVGVGASAAVVLLGVEVAHALAGVK